MTENTKNRLRKLMDRSVRLGETAGVSLLVRQQGREVFYGECGCADIKAQIPIRRDTIFRLYSMTKPVTAVAAMILVEQGLLDLNMPVSQVLPLYENACVSDARLPLERPVTVNHLLNMTSGLTYGEDATAAGRELQAYIEQCSRKLHTPQRLTTEQIAQGLASFPLAFQPDSHWCYGFSADVLGAVIEKVSGMSFGAFLKKNLFEPLNMNDTGFYVPDEKYSRLARVYDSTQSGAMEEFTQDYLLVNMAMDSAPGFESGGAGLVSTIDDYARFGQMLLSGGELEGNRILSPHTVGFLLSGDLTPVQQADFRRFGGHEGYTYSHLMRRLTDPGAACLMSTPGEYGWAGWLGCYFANIPEADMTVLLMQQKAHSGTTALARAVRNVITADR